MKIVQSKITFTFQKDEHLSFKFEKNTEKIKITIDL
ncbi:hypothetical protein CLSAP_40000 [Clostridium saccharoperbutylacetonicum]|jgi:hypothetical protein|nr:hypothetical protein CLSAP_40000 [Clostridium saccharoperbutylacetonicum]NSB32552.1 hypothetical protein [Clostridium saccharoperbutylacetonicum]